MKNNRLLIAIAFLCVLPAALYSQVQDGSIPPSFHAPSLSIGDALPVATLAPPDMATIDYQDRNEAPMGEIPRIGVSLPVLLNLSNSGKWTVLPNGGRIWRLKINAPGAKAVGLYYNDLYIPQGAKLYVYNEDKTEVQGGFTSSSNPSSGYFATSPVTGETTVIEYYEPQSVTGQGRIQIHNVAYIYRNWDLYKNVESSRDFGDSENCQVNVNCSPEGNGKTNQRDATVRILVTVQGGQGWCSGSLINNVTQNCTPYLLTALHCGLNSSNVLTTAGDLNQWIFYFKYQAAGCTDPASQGTLANSFITGAVHRANSNDGGGDTGSDFLLLELNTTPPLNYNPYYAGWNRNNTASASGYGIHHPAGDIKKISTYTSSLSSTSWGGSTANTHWQVSWSATTNGHGVTEGGSSGSPLFNSSGQIVGTLTGGSSFCSSPTSPDLYGKFSYHWLSNGAANNRRLSPWLDPGSSGVTSLNGIYAPCSVNPLDAGIDDILNPPDGQTICSSTILPQVVIRNFGTTTLTSATINYRINTNPVGTFAWTGSLPAGSSDTVTLPSVTVPTGAAFTFRSYTTLPNGGTDGNLTNDTSVAVSQYETSAPLPYAQGFNTGSLPATITVYDPDGDGFAWEHTTSESAYGVGTGSIIFDNYSGTQSNNPGGTLDWFFLPTLDFSTTGSATLTFDVAYARYNNSISDSLIVAVATNCGTQYLIEYMDGGTSLATAPNNTNAFAPTNSQWTNESVDLSAYAGQSHVSIAFINFSDWGNNIYVDNINITGTPSCTDTTISVNASICSGQTYALPWGGTVSTAGTYSHTYVTSEGCDSTRNIVLTINAAPNVNGGTDRNICPGTTITLTASGASTYSWTGGITNGAPFTPAASQTYIVTGTAANGCTDKDTVQVNIYPQPSVSAGPDVTVCTGSSVTLNGSGASTYSWSGGISNGVPFTPAATTTYTVTGTSLNGCTNTDAVTVTVASSLNVSAGPDQFVCPGNAVTLTGTGALIYSWTNGVTDGVPFAPAGTQTYIVTGTDGGSCSDKDTVVVNILTAPTVSAGSDVSVCAGSSVTLSGSGASTYSWTGGVTNGSSFTPAATTTYTVTGTDANGCTNTDAVIVTVNPLPTVGITPSASTFCINEGGITLTGSPSGGSLAGPGISGSLFSPAGAGAGAHNITYTFTDGNNCTNTAQATITVLTCVGLEDINAGGTPTVYPNPGTGAAWLQFPQSWAGNVVVRLCTLDGKTVNTWNRTADFKDPLYFDLSGLSAGVYIFTVEKNGQRAHLRWIKN